MGGRGSCRAEAGSKTAARLEPRSPFEVSVCFSAGKEAAVRIRTCGYVAYVLALLCVVTIAPAKGEIQPGEMAGYLLVPNARVPESYNAGFSMYVAAWPLVKEYPGHRFQSGLFGTWMHAQYEGRAPDKLYSDVEGGLGWWRDTRFPTETPKFIMGGVGPNFSDIANGPAHGWGTWEEGRCAAAESGGP